jgi:hypothetical protein
MPDEAPDAHAVPTPIVRWLAEPEAQSTGALGGVEPNRSNSQMRLVGIEPTSEP